MHFELSHELDAPLEAVERAVLSPELGELLGRRLRSMASVDTVEHVLEDGELRRVLRFQASAPLALFKGRQLAHDAMTWHEHVVYRIDRHASTWKVKTMREQWDRYFSSEGTYHLEPIGKERTRRTVVGEIDIRLRVLGPVAERMALAEVRKTYDAEAEVLRELATHDGGPESLPNPPQ